MNYDLEKIKYNGDYKFLVFFKDGTKGEVDFYPVIKNVKAYKNLEDINQFKKAYIDSELKVLTWNKNLDYDPIILYYKANKIPFPQEWGEII